MTTPEFLALLLAAVAKMVPDDAGMSDADRAASLSIARTLFEAFEPADPLAAAQAAHAVAACLAAMDSFARAARSGVPDEKAIRLRSNALAAGRVFDAAVRVRRGKQLPARAEPQPRPPRRGHRLRWRRRRRVTGPNCRCRSPAWPMR